MSNTMSEQQKAIQGPRLNRPDSVAIASGSEIWHGDCLNRKQFAQELASIVSAQTEALTIAINGTWGTGKSFFLNRFAEQYRKDGGTAVSLNVWEDDELSDPFVPIVSVLWNELENTCCDIREPLLKSVGKIVYGVLKSGVMCYIEKSPALSAVKNAVESVGDALNEVSESFVTVGDKFITAYMDATADKKEFKEQLTKAAQLNFERTRRPLLFIIDELDRCRPTYAIQVLERVKHLFGVPHLVFLFGVDRTQLEKTIQSAYGNIDVNDYLHRFFDVELSMPKSRVESFVGVLVNQYFFRVYGNSPEDDTAELSRICQGGLVKTIKGLAMNCHLTLREIENAFRCFMMMDTFLLTRDDWYGMLAAFVAVLKIRYPAMLKKLSSEKQKFDIVECFNVMFGGKIEKPRDYALGYLVSLLFYLSAEWDGNPEKIKFIEEWQPLLGNVRDSPHVKKNVKFHYDFMPQCVWNDPTLLRDLDHVVTGWQNRSQEFSIDEIIRAISCLNVKG